jgi:NADPH:quinone reductase-like Zn-dependent oxidoreductase
MKAVLLTKHGEPEMLCYGEAPDPSADPGEVVVDMCAASVNAADSKVRMGGGRYALIRFPHILGRDFSGVVSALGVRSNRSGRRRGLCGKDKLVGVRTRLQTFEPPARRRLAFS